jgi:hypothetical protein
MSPKKRCDRLVFDLRNQADRMQVMKTILTSLMILIACSMALMGAELRYVVVHDQDKNEYAGWWDDDTSILHLKGDRREWYPDRSKVVRVESAKAPEDAPMPAYRVPRPASSEHGDLYTKRGDFIGTGWFVVAAENFTFIKDGNAPMNVSVGNNAGEYQLRKSGAQSPLPKEVTRASSALAIKTWVAP